MSTLTAPAPALEAAAKAAGLTLTATEPGTDFSGKPTVRATVTLASDTSKTETLELSETFDASETKFAPLLATYFHDAALRLKNPRPNVYLTLSGLPLSFTEFAWPFHGSTSGADTYIVHGLINLETGDPSELHAKVSASLTQTFKDVLAALEQPFAEGVIINAVRKTLDQGQLELVKSGNRQPVPVTTRYFSQKQQVFVFNDTTADQRRAYLAAKVYWLSFVLGNDAPVWVADPRDAQYLNTSVEDLKTMASEIASSGLISLHEDWATATTSLKAKAESYKAEVAEALAFIKPSFNEDMRAGHTNM
jgi:hypothetical protein